MVPWKTFGGSAPKINQALPFDIAWGDLCAFIFPIYGKSLPQTLPFVGQALWATSACFWIVMILVRRRRCAGRPNKHQAEMDKLHIGLGSANARWLQESGTYANMDLAISFYLLISSSCVYFSGFYTVSGVQFRNSKSLFGALQKGPETWQCTSLRFFCGTMFLCSSLLLVSVQTFRVGQSRLRRNIVVVCLWGCFIAYTYVRRIALFVERDPHKSILAVDWAMFGIVVSLSMRGLGVPEWICSRWLKKMITLSLSLMYLNAGISKLQATGLVWFAGEILRQLIRDFRSTSAWPWLSDLIVDSPEMGILLGSLTFVWEILLSSIMILEEMPLCACTPMPRFARLCSMRPRVSAAIRWCWVLTALGCHFGIYLLVFPPFTTFVHALTLAVDLSQYLEKTKTSLKIECDLDPEGACKSPAQAELHDNASGLHQRPHNASSHQDAHDMTDTAKVANTIRTSCCESDACLRFSKIPFLLYVSLWIYVGIQYTNIDRHPLLPFSSFSMFSTYKARALQHRGPWDLSAHPALQTTPNDRRAPMRRSGTDARVAKSPLKNATNQMAKTPMINMTKKNMERMAKMDWMVKGRMTQMERLVQMEKMHRSSKEGQLV